MDGDNPIRDAMELAPSTPKDADNPIRAAMDPASTFVPRVLEQAGRDKWSWDRLESGLKEVGANPDEYKHLKPQLDLETARNQARLRGESTSQVFRRKFMPFGDVVGTNFLPDVPDAVNPEIGGAKQFGGRVVGNKEYADAVSRFQAGKHTDDDVQAIAQYEAAQGTDRAMKDAPFAYKLADALGGLGKIGGEMFAGGQALNLGAKGVAAVRGTKAVAAAATGVAPAVPEAASLASRVAGGLANKASQTAVAPSMWVPLMQQRNMQEGRDPNDIKGLPSAFGYGVANMVVLGKLQKGLTSGTSIEAMAKGVLGMAELQGVDAASGVLDQFLPQAYAVHGHDERWGTVGEWARAYNRGDKEGAMDALEHASIQAISFAAFARVHGKEVEAPKTLLKSYADAIGELRKTGLSKNEAGEQVKNLHDVLENGLQAEPYMTREAARERLNKFVEESGRSKELKGYANDLADAFPPKKEVEKAPEPDKPASSPEVKKLPQPEGGEAPADYHARLITEGVEPGRARIAARAHFPAFEPAGGSVAAAQKAAAEPPKPLQSSEAQPASAEEAKYNLFNEQLAKFQNDGKTLDEAKAAVRSMFPKFFEAATSTATPVAAAATPATPPGTPRALADHLETEMRRIDSAINSMKPMAAAAERNAATGGSPAEAARLNGELRRLARQQNEVRKNLQAARDAALLAEAGSRKEPAASPPEATAAAPVEPKVETPSTPAEAPITPPASPAESRRARMEAIRRAGATGEVSPAPIRPAERLPEPPPPAAAAGHPDAVVNLARAAAGANPKLTRQQSHDYVKSFTTLVESMPPAARALLSANVKRVAFYDKPSEAGIGNAREWVNHPEATPEALKYWGDHLKRLEDPAAGVQALGAFNPLTGTLHIDGQGLGGSTGGAAGRYPMQVAGGKKGVATRELIYAHEMGHAIDGALVNDKGFIVFKTSSTVEWRGIHAGEFGPKAKERIGVAPLTEYGSTTSGESFAEFCRILYSGDIPTSQIARDFPRATKFFKDKGLWPEERGPAVPPEAHTSAPEVFVGNVGPKVGHVDVAGEKPLDSAPEKPTGSGPASENTPPLEPTIAESGASKVESAVKAAFGPGFSDTGSDAKVKQYSAVVGGREVNVVYDPENHTAQVDFFTPAAKTSEVFERGGGVRQGSVALGRTLQNLARGLHDAGAKITYTADQGRHEAYSRTLEKNGYELTQSEVDPEPPNAGSFTWSPKADPAAAATRTPWKRRAGGAEPKPEPAPEPKPAAVDGLTEAVNEQASRRAKRSYEGLTPTEVEGTKEYDRLRDKFVDEMASEAKLHSRADVADQLGDIVYNGLPNQTVGSSMWENAAQGKDVKGYARDRVQEMINRLRRAVAGRDLPQEQQSKLLASIDLATARLDKAAAAAKPKAGGRVAATVELKQNGEFTEQDFWDSEGYRPRSQEEFDAYNTSFEHWTKWQKENPTGIPAAAASPAPAAPRAKFTPPAPPPPRVRPARVRPSDAPLTAEEQAIEAAKAEAKAAPTADELDAEKLDVGRVKRSGYDLTTPYGVSEFVAKAEGITEAERRYLLGRVLGQTTVEAAKQYDVTRQAVEQSSDAAAKKLGFADFDDLMRGVRGESKVASTRDAEAVTNAEGVRVATQNRGPRGTTTTSPGAIFKAEERSLGEMTADGKGVPVTLFERLLGRAGESGGGIRSWFRKLIFGDLPEFARTAYAEEATRRIAAHAFDVASTAKDFRAAIIAEGKTYEKLTREELDNYDQLLRVPHTETLAAAARSSVPPRTAEVIRSMRIQIDKLSNELMAIGAVDGPLAAAIQENLGIYVTRQFEVFTNPEWYKKVDAGVVNRFKSWLYTEYMKHYGEEPDMEEIDAKVKSLLVNGTAAENPIAFLSTSRLGSKDLSILQSRKDLPPELLALWGEFRDPLVNYTNTVGKVGNLVANHNFLRRIAGEGMGKVFFETAEKAGVAFPESKGAVMFAPEGGETMSPLNGMWTTPEIKRAFDEVYQSKELPPWLTLYMKALSLAKLSKVVLSHTGQIKNFLSNVGIAIRNGYWRVDKLPTAFKAIFSDTPEARADWRRKVELGVVGEELNYRDFAETVKDALGGREGMSAKNNLFTRFLQGAKNVAEKMYRYGDSFWKVYAFENEMADYRKAYPELPKESVEEMVAKIVIAQNPTYSEVPQGVKNLRRLPFVAPFVSFQAEMVRTTKNTILQAFKELGDPVTRGIGAKRLAGLVAAAAAPAALAAWLRALQGVDDSEEKAIRRFLPDHEKESTLWFVGRDQSGRPKYIDGSRTDPHAYLGDAIMAAMRAKNPKEAAANAGSELAKPFISEELLARPALDIARNRKEPGGEVYNPMDTTAAKAGAIGGHVASAFAPGGYGPARRLFMGMSGAREEKSGKAYDAADAGVESVTGQRIEDVDVERLLSNKARGFEAMRGQAAKITGEKIRARGDVSDSDLQSAAAATVEGRKQAFEDFGEDVRAAERLGISRGRIIKILHDSGVSEEDADALLAGRVPRFMPEVTGTPQERQRAIAVRKGGR